METGVRQKPHATSRSTSIGRPAVRAVHLAHVAPQFLHLLRRSACARSSSRAGTGSRSSNARGPAGHLKYEKRVLRCRSCASVSTGAWHRGHVSRRDSGCLAPAALSWMWRNSTSVRARRQLQHLLVVEPEPLAGVAHVDRRPADRSSAPASAGPSSRGSWGRSWQAKGYPDFASPTSSLPPPAACSLPGSKAPVTQAVGPPHLTGRRAVPRARSAPSPSGQDRGRRRRPPEGLLLRDRCSPRGAADWRHP